VIPCAAGVWHPAAYCQAETSKGGGNRTIVLVLSREVGRSVEGQNQNFVLNLRTVAVAVGIRIGTGSANGLIPRTG